MNALIMFFVACYTLLILTGQTTLDKITKKNQVDTLRKHMHLEDVPGPFDEVEDTEWLSSMNPEPVHINAGKTKVSGWFVKKENSHRWVICMHSYTAEPFSMSHYAEKFFNQGFNIIIPDCVGFGDSQKDYYDLGAVDGCNLSLWEKTILQIDEAAQIVFYGQSTGAAACLLYAPNAGKHVKLVISDSCYTDFRRLIQLHYQMANANGSIVIKMADTVSRFKRKYSLIKDLNVIESVKKASIPELFIHGEEDCAIPFEMANSLYEAHQGIRNSLIVSDAGHLMEEYTAPELYWTTVFDFINEHISEEEICVEG